MRRARLPRWTVGLVALLVPLLVGADDAVPPPSIAALRTWRSDWPRHCLRLERANVPAPDVEHLERLVAYVEQERSVGAPLVAVARRERVPICLDDGCRGLFGYYDAGSSWIGVRSDLTFPQQAVTLVHELRHLDQVARGFAPSLDHACSEAVRLVCAHEADAQAVTALYAWRRRQLGDWDPWRALSGFERYADLPAAFARVAAAGDDELAAAAATFERWFASDWRTTTYRRNAASDFLDTLDERHAIERYDPLPPSHYQGFCVLPSGAAYDCDPVR